MWVRAVEPLWPGNRGGGPPPTVPMDQWFTTTPMGPFEGVQDFTAWDGLTAARVERHLEIGGRNVQRDFRIVTLGCPGGVPPVGYPFADLDDYALDTTVTLGWRPDLIIVNTAWFRGDPGITGVPDFADWQTATQTGGDADISWGASDRFGNMWSWAIANNWWITSRFRWFTTAGVLCGSYAGGQWGNGDIFGGGGPTYPLSGITDEDVTTVTHNTDGYTFHSPAPVFGDGQKRGHVGCHVGVLALRFPSTQVRVGSFVQPASTGVFFLDTGIKTDALLLCSNGPIPDQTAFSDGSGYQFGTAVRADQGGQGSSSHYKASTVAGVDHEAFAPLGRCIDWQKHPTSFPSADAPQYFARAAALFQGLPTGINLSYTVNDGTPNRYGYIAWETDEAYADWPQAPLASIHMRADRSFWESNVYRSGDWWFYGNVQDGPTIGLAASKTARYAVGCTFNYVSGGDEGSRNAGEYAGLQPSFSVTTAAWDLLRDGTEILVARAPIFYRRRV